jgi:mRNA interferase MazF
MPKNFPDWFKKKPKLDALKHKPPFVKERDLWWCHLGENIGTEINGKGRKFNRPAIIFKKLSQFTFLVIPVSTKIKTGTWFIPFTYQGIDMVSCLQQIRITDYRRLDNKVGELSKNDFQSVKQGFDDLYK